MAKLVTEEPAAPVEVITVPVATNSPEPKPSLEELAELLDITGELLEETAATAEAAAGAAEAAAEAAEEAQTEEESITEEEENSSEQSSVPATPVLSDAQPPETNPPEKPKQSRTGLRKLIFG